MDKEMLIEWVEQSQGYNPPMQVPIHVFDSEHEWEWERVQRRRAEGKCLGGYYRDFISTYASEVKLAYDRERQLKYQRKCNAKKQAEYKAEVKLNEAKTTP